MNASPQSERISVTVTPGVTSTRHLPTRALRRARKAMFAGKPVTDADLRALADHGDGLAAQRYTHRLLAQPGGASASDIAYYASIAVRTGRVWTLPDAVAAMRRLDPDSEPDSRKKVYISILYPYAWAGNTLALDAVIDLNGEGKLFGPLSEATRRQILEQAGKNGDGRAELRLALALLRKRDLAPQERAEARGYLQRAAATDNLAVKATSANLLALMETGAKQ